MDKVSLEKIFNQQLKRVLIVVIIILFLILASILGIVYRYVYQTQKQQARTSINYFFNQTAHGLKDIEAQYNQQLERNLSNFYKNYTTSEDKDYLKESMSKIKNDIYQLNKGQRLTVENVNYYFINSQGTIFATDYAPDQGLDLSEFEQFWSKLEQLQPGEVLLMPFDNETLTSRMRLYAYLKLPDGNYFEIGILFKNLEQFLSNKIKSINHNPSFNLQLFTYEFDPLFKGTEQLTAAERKLLERSDKQNKLIIKSQSFFKEKYYQAWQSKHGKLYVVLESDHELLQMILNLIILLFVVIIVAVYLAKQKLHQKIEQILIPIQKISEDMNNFYKTQETNLGIEDTGIIELDNILDNYRNMSNEISASYQQLEAYSEELEDKNRELAQNKRKLRKIIDLSPNHIFIKDRSGKYILVNKTHANFFSKTVEEFEGITEQELYELTDDEINSFLESDRQVIEEHTRQDFEEYAVDDEGNQIVFDTTKIPFIEADETYVLAIARDITQEREAQTRIKEQKEELEASYQQLEAYNKEILDLNQNLEAAYQERDKLVNKLEKLIDLSSELTRESLTDTREFLSQLLQSAFEIIETADYGSVYIFGEQYIEFVDTIGHDLEALKNLDIKKEIFASNPSSPEIIKNITVNTQNKLDKNLQDSFLEATQPIKETIVFALTIDGERKAGFSLDIAQGNEAKFSQQDVQISEAFNNLAVSFYIMQSYSDMRSEFQTQIVNSLINLLEVHDQYTKGHSENVARLGTKVAFELGLSIEEINDVYWAGLLHDIGKTVIPEEILNKPGQLNEEEYKKIKKHPVWGYKALKESDQLKEIAEYIHYHHERPDGQGYPEGLTGEDIPLVAKILSVVDAWDAMRSTRSYRAPLSKEKALKEILSNRGEQFSAEIVDAFVKIIKNKQ